ncbi:uncharacterized protein [Argopecten irradians]|uniref:uncharacterized protein n=1 Tax=Argopecten irradians TaxID=31199 RepID=UPI00371917F9
MAANTYIDIFIGVILSVFGFATSDICYSTNSRYSYIYNDIKYYTDSTYCSYTAGCCSTYGSAATCCSSSIYYYYYDIVYYTTSLSTGAIVGIVVGCLTALGIFIAIIICCCCACCRSQGSRQAGQVLTPVGATGAMVISTQNTTTQQGYAPQPYPQAQPGPAMAPAYPGNYNQAYVPDSTQAAGPVTAPYANTGAVAPPPYTNKY